MIKTEKSGISLSELGEWRNSFTYESNQIHVYSMRPFDLGVIFVSFASCTMNAKIIF